MLILRTNGKIDRVDLGGRKVTLEQLQAAVGGYIQGVPGTNSRVYCDEDGLNKGYSFNEQASLVFGVRLVGDIAVLEPRDEQ